MVRLDRGDTGGLANGQTGIGNILGVTQWSDWDRRDTGALASGQTGIGEILGG